MADTTLNRRRILAGTAVALASPLAALPALAAVIRHLPIATRP